MCQVRHQGRFRIEGGEPLDAASARELCHEVEGEVGGGAVEIVVFALPVLVAGHGRDAVLAEGTVEVERGRAGEHQVGSLRLGAAASVSGAVAVILVPVARIIHRHIVRAEHGLGGQTLYEFDLRVEGGEQTGRIGLVDVHVRDGDRVEVAGNRVAPVVLLLAAFVEYIVAVVVNLVHWNRVGERQGVVEWRSAGALRNFGVLGGIGEEDVTAALEPFVHLGVHRGLAGVARVAGRRGGTFLIEVAAGHEISDLVAAAGITQVVILRETRREDDILPVGIDDDAGATRHVAAGVERLFHIVRVPAGEALGLEVGRLDIVTRFQIAHERLLVIFGGVHHLVGLRHGTKTELGVEVHVTAARLAALGGDDYHAIGGTGAVKGGCGGILQHRDGFDVLRVDGGHDAAGRVGIGRVLRIAGIGGGHAIDHIERFSRSVQGTRTTDTERRRGARLAGSSGHLETGDLALDGLFDGRDGFLRQLLGANHGGGTRIGRLLGRTVGDDQHILEHFSIGSEHHVDPGAAGHFDFLRLVAYEAVNKDRVGRARQYIGTVVLRGRARRSSFHENGNVRKGLSRSCIRDSSLYLDALRSGIKAWKRKQQKQKECQIEIGLFHLLCYF